MNMTHSPSLGTKSILGHLFAKQWEKAINSPYLALLVVASFLLSAASFFTTFQGMLHFMHVALIAAAITFAIQALLLVTSWKIGFMYAEDAKVSGMILVIFIITFVTSVFFSFSSLFDYVFDADTAERTRMSRVHDAVEQSNNELNELSKEREFRLVTQLLESDGYQNWRANMDKVGLAALEAKARLREILQQRAEESAQQAASLASAAGSLEAEKAFREKDLRDLQFTIGEYELERKDLRERVNSLKREKTVADQKVFAKETQMDAEERGGDPGSNRPRGRGPVWLKVKQERDKLAAERDGVGKALVSAENDFESLKANLLEMQQKVAEHQSALSGIDARIAATQGEADKAQSIQQQAVQQEDFDPESVVATMRNNVTEFARTRELAPFDQAANSCERLLSEMNDTPEIRDSVQGLSCDRGAMELQLNEIITANQHQNDLRRACIKGGANTKSIGDLSFDETLKYGFDCVGLVSLPTDDVSDITSELRRIEREESPTTSKFTVTTNAIAAGEKLAWFALIGAIIIDALVLACGLIGAKSAQSVTLTALDVDLEPHPADPPRFQVIKLILTHAGPVTHTVRNAKNFEAEIDLGLVDDPAERRGLQQAMLAFISQQKAAHDQEAEGVFYLRPGLLQQLRDDLSAYQDKAVLRRGHEQPVPSNGQIKEPIYSPGADGVVEFEDLIMEDPDPVWDSVPNGNGSSSSSGQSARSGPSTTHDGTFGVDDSGASMGGEGSFFDESSENQSASPTANERDTSVGQGRSGPAPDPVEEERDQGTDRKPAADWRDKIKRQASQGGYEK